MGLQDGEMLKIGEWLGWWTCVRKQWGKSPALRKGAGKTWWETVAGDLP
jgi:hypothetical protein